MSNIEQHITILKKGELEMITACFNEYYFIIPEQVIKPDAKNFNVYTIGDELPINGDTYNFPAFNMMGFSINLKSQQDYDEYVKDFNSFKITEREKLTAFANKWFDIVKYRKI